MFCKFDLLNKSRCLLIMLLAVFSISFRLASAHSDRHCHKSMYLSPRSWSRYWTEDEMSRTALCVGPDGEHVASNAEQIALRSCLCDISKGDRVKHGGLSFNHTVCCFVPRVRKTSPKLSRTRYRRPSRPCFLGRQGLATAGPASPCRTRAGSGTVS